MDLCTMMSFFSYLHSKLSIHRIKWICMFIYMFIYMVILANKETIYYDK